MFKTKNFYITLLALVFVLVATSMLGCSGGGVDTNGDEEATPEDIETVKERPDSVQDMFGRDVNLPESIERVVVVGGVLNHLSWLGVDNKVVGVEEIETRPTEQSGGRVYRWANPAFGELPSIGPAARPEAEMIASAEPHIVFFASLAEEGVVNLQNQLTVPVIGLKYPEFGPERENENFFKQLRLVATVMEKEERAEDIIAWIEGSLADLQKRSAVADANNPSCYVGGILQGPDGTGFTSTMPYYPSFVMLNANNVITADDISLMTPGTLGRYIIDIEFIVEKNPEFIFIDRAGSGPTKMQYEQNSAVLRHLDAIANDNVYGILPWHSYNNNIETMFINAYFIGKALYPDNFADIDPIKKAEDIYTFWYGTSVYNELSEALEGGLEAFNF